MASLEALTARSLRSYELGRLRMAARVALVLLPVIALCLLEPVGRETCACCAVLLLGAALWLRFRSRAGVESVTTGLLAGTVPLAAALAFEWLDFGCATAGLVSSCTVFSVLIGAAAGAIVALRERVTPRIPVNWLVAAGIALLTASLGCARLGLASIAGVALGLLLGRVSVLRST